MNAARILSRRDLDFLLFDWLQAETLIHRPRHADHSRETFAAALDTYARIAEDYFAPHNKTSDQNEPSFDGERVTVIPEVGIALSAFSNAGLMAARQDEHFGGMSLPFVLERAGMAYLMAANLATSGYAFLTIANAELLLAYASPDLVERFVRPMMEGRFLGTMCLSETQAGSSLGDIRTRAQPRPDGTYRISGNKMWISGGDHELSENIVHLVLAKIPARDGTLPPGVQGISLFLVPKYLQASNSTERLRNDVVLAGLNHKMGYRGLANCVMSFGEGRHRPDGEPGAVGYLVGEPGKGLACMFKMMNEARIAVGLSAAALGYTGYLHALDYARERLQGRPPSAKQLQGPQVPIIQHPDVRRMLLAQKAYAEGGLALALYSAKLIDDIESGTDVDEQERAERLLGLLTPVTKSWPAQWCVAGNDLAIQVHGGSGYTRDFTVEQFYRDNRLNPIHEGTFGIQALDLLGRKLRDPSDPALADLDARIRATLDEAIGARALACDADQLRLTWSDLRHALEGLHTVGDDTLRLANAGPFLEAFGHVVVAWLWLQQGLVASKLLRRSPNQETEQFLRGKLQCCHYFHHWELPKVAVWISVLEPVNTICLDMQPEWF